MTVADLIELLQSHNPEADRVEKRPATDLTPDMRHGDGDA